MGYSLSDKGLFVVAKDADKTTKRVKLTKSIPCETEEDVFRALRLPFMPRSAMITYCNHSSSLALTQPIVTHTLPNPSCVLLQLSK